MCECKEGSVCGTSKYCGIPNYATSIYLASQGCNKRKWDDGKEGKEGWLGVGHKVGWRGWVQGGGYRALMVPVVRVSFGHIPESRHT